MRETLIGCLSQALQRGTRPEAQQLFALWDCTQPSEPHQSGFFCDFKVLHLTSTIFRVLAFSALTNIYAVSLDLLANFFPNVDFGNQNTVHFLFLNLKNIFNFYFLVHFFIKLNGPPVHHFHY